MISEEFKKIIEQEADRIREVNPMLVGARRGEIQVEQMRKYLMNLMFFFRHTPIHLEKARTVAQQRGLEKLALFFDEKINEEKNHDLWAKSDLKAFGVDGGEVDLRQLTPGMFELLALAKRLIDEDPAYFVPYMLFMEYWTVIDGPELLANLETRCGILSKNVTALGYHVELDKDHVKDDLEVLEWSSQGASHEGLRQALLRTSETANRAIGECGLKN